MSKQEPKVLLIYPPNQLMDIEVPRPDGSLGPLYLAGALRAIGIEVDVLDASVGGDGDSLRETFYRREELPNGLTRIGMSSDRIREHVARGGYDIVGIHSNFTPQTRMALEVAACVKEVNPEILVIAGGVNARAMPDRFLKSGAVDVIATSEAENTIVEIVRAWQTDLPFHAIDGVMFRRGDRIIHQPALATTYYTDLDGLPFPAWDKLPFDKYDSINAPHGAIHASEKRRYASLMTSRGCPFWCSYCHVSEEKHGGVSGNLGALRLKSQDRVMAEVEILQGLGVTHLYLEDDSLLAKKARVKRLFELLTGRGLKISNVNGVNLVHFGLPTRDGRLRPDEEYLQIMKAAGFDEIVFPVESGNQRILDKYASGKLNHSKLDVVELVRMAVEVGIACPVNMMIGFPDETEAEMRESIELGRRLVGEGAPYVTFFIPIPFPGSELFREALKHGHIRPDFDPDLMNWKNAIMKNTTVPPERIVELRDWAWHSVNRDEYKRRRVEREIRTRVAATTG